MDRRYKPDILIVAARFDFRILFAPDRAVADKSDEARDEKIPVSKKKVLDHVDYEHSINGYGALISYILNSDREDDVRRYDCTSIEVRVGFLCLFLLVPYNHQQMVLNNDD